MPPRDADFAIRIDFLKGEGNPRRVFDAASQLVSALQQFDSTVAAAIDTKLEPILVLEDVDSGSLRIWLKNVVKHLDDEALKTIDWKPLIGQYFVKAKYIALEWLDENKDTKRNPKIEDLSNKLKKLAEQTDVRHLPDYAPIHNAKLARSLDSFQDAKNYLGPNDKLTIETEDKVYEVDLSSTWHPSELLDDAELVDPINTTAELILVIKKPDMIGNSMWEFRHGKTRVIASMSDGGWLQRFHNREIPVFPGDALRCDVKFSHQFDKKGNLVDQKTEITKVLGKVEGSDIQGDFFENE